METYGKMKEKTHSKELKKLLKELEEVTKGKKAKKISNYEVIRKQEEIFNKIKKNHWYELDRKNKIIVNMGLKTIKMTKPLLNAVNKLGKIT